MHRAAGHADDVAGGAAVQALPHARPAPQPAVWPARGAAGAAGQARLWQPAARLRGGAAARARAVPAAVHRRAADRRVEHLLQLRRGRHPRAAGLCPRRLDHAPPGAGEHAAGSAPQVRPAARRVEAAVLLPVRRCAALLLFGRDEQPVPAAWRHRPHRRRATAGHPRADRRVRAGPVLRLRAAHQGAHVAAGRTLGRGARRVGARAVQGGSAALVHRCRAAFGRAGARAAAGRGGIG
mmetsp:Transcript_9263/g.30654  ORF Transcript_9263/g.30654 Transcript_9263/m.30654 type:complete len:238 (-) Transcript_9263:1228-1941(-)